MQKTKKLDFLEILLIIFNTVFILAMIFALSLGVIHPYYENLKAIFIILVAVVEIIIFYFLMKITKNLSTKSLIIISIINIVIFLVILSIFGYELRVKPSWDFGTVYEAALEKASGHSRYLSAYYYDLYPNNIFITVIWAWIYKIFKVFSISYFYGSIVLNMIFELITVVVLYFLIKNLYGLRIATIYSFFILLMTPFYSYAPIFYTDTISMLFLPISYLLFNKYLKKQNWIYLIIIGILAAIGIGIRNNIVIGYIALIIFIIFKFKNIKIILKSIVGIIVPIIILMAVINGICQSNIPRPLAKSGFPFTHWIMMGMQGDGAYSASDVEASLKAGPNKENIERFNKKVIKERLENFGVEGYIKFLVKKNELTWGDGTLGGPFYLEREPLNTGTMYQYVVKGKNDGFLYLGQGTQLFMLIFIVISGLSLYKDRKNMAMLCNITIFGTFLFLMIWETCPRYLFCILPLMILSACNGIKLIDKRSSKNKK